jgi:hypothetical protein
VHRHAHVGGARHAVPGLEARYRRRDARNGGEGLVGIESKERRWRARVAGRAIGLRKNARAMPSRSKGDDLQVGQCLEGPRQRRPLPTEDGQSLRSS